MSWLFLTLAILLEVTGTTCLKLSAGFTRPVYSLAVIAFYVASFWCLGLALRTIEVSVAYAIWAGAGTALIALIGMVGFRESVTLFKTVCLVLIVLGVAGLNLSGAKAPDIGPAAEMPPR